MWYQRQVSAKIKRLATQYPIVTITGPRQSGKTSLSKKLFPKYKYVSLESLDFREIAQTDPRSFLEQFSSNTIIDEVQRVPDLFSYLQSHVDERGENGQFILTGSHQFEMFSGVTQSLAGRTAIVKLLPLALDEIYQEKEELKVEEVLHRGFYPRVIKENLKASEAYSFYTETYLQKDVRALVNVKDISKFERFLKLCAARAGQVVNYTEISNVAGVDQNTVKSWLSILETSFILKLVPPYFTNLSKKLVKSPKLYFQDTGVLCFLLGIYEAYQLINHPLFGSIFENWVFTETWKYQENNILKNDLYFFRDHKGHEVDLIADYVTHLDPLEIKASKTIFKDMFKQLNYLKKSDLSIRNSYVLYGGEENMEAYGTKIFSWRNISSLLQEMFR